MNRGFYSRWKDARSEDARRNIGSKEPHQVRERRTGKKAVNG